MAEILPLDGLVMTLLLYYVRPMGRTEYTTGPGGGDPSRTAVTWINVFAAIPNVPEMARKVVG
jgi:hypothetical protein